jgi:hypothetical protein
MAEGSVQGRIYSVSRKASPDPHSLPDRLDIPDIKKAGKKPALKVVREE